MGFIRQNNGGNNDDDEDSESSNPMSDSEIIALYIVFATIGLLLCVLISLCHHRQRQRILNHEYRINTRTAPSQLNSSAIPPTILSYPIPNDQLVDKVCPVCLEDLKCMPVSAGACLHPVHTHCLNRWLVYDHLNDNHLPSCPVCRAPYQIVNVEGKTDSDDVLVNSNDVVGSRLNTGVIIASTEQDNEVIIQRQQQQSSQLNSERNFGNQGHGHNAQTAVEIEDNICDGQQLQGNESCCSNGCLIAPEDISQVGFDNIANMNNLEDLSMNSIDQIRTKTIKPAATTLERT